MSARARIAIVLDSEGIGGAELTMSAIAGGLARDLEVTSVLGDRSAPETRQRLVAAGTALELVRGLRRRCTPPGFARLLARLRNLRPDLVHVSCTDQGGGIAPLLAARLLRLPTVATLHLVSPGRRRWRERVSAFTLSRASEPVAVSASVGEYLAGLGIPATVVMNGVALPPQRDDARDVLGVRGDAAIVIGGIGRLHHHKGWDVLCRAAAIVHEQEPDADFIVIGDGPEAEALRRAPDCEHVRFVGAVDDAASLLGGFDVFTVPSRWEGFGRVVVEAMLASVPVVASDVGGIPEVVGDAGMLVPSERPEPLAEAINALVESPGRRRDMGEQGRRRAVELFTEERMIEGIRDAYARVLDRPLT
jgi:glycosyltransferase involved in cell wall biosynthesis